MERDKERGEVKGDYVQKTASGKGPGDPHGGDNGGTVKEKENKKQEVKKKPGMINPLRPRLLSLKNAAFYLGRTEWGMRELYWANKIPWVRDGKKIYFDVQDLDFYIERNKTTFV